LLIIYFIFGFNLWGVKMSQVQLQINSGAWGRDEAIARLRSKYQLWIDRVGAPVLERVCREREFFTSDDVWVGFGAAPSPHERRVMGALIRGFALKGLILKTGVSEPSVMAACHRRDKSLWRSLMFVHVPVESRKLEASPIASEWKAE
jgi:hypothetical protein